MYYKIIKKILDWYYPDNKISFSAYTYMPVEWYIENYNNFRVFDRMYMGWLGNDWDSDLNILHKYYSKLQGLRKKHYIVFRFNSATFFQHRESFIRIFTELANMLKDDLSHIAGICFDTEYIAPYYKYDYEWYEYGRLIHNILKDARKDLDIRVMPIGIQHKYSDGWIGFARGINPNVYIDERIYSLRDFKSIYNNKKDLYNKGYANVETAFFPLGKNDDYTDKHANYPIDEFENQIKYSRSVCYYEAMIYMHGAWYQINNPDKYMLPWYNLDAYQSPVVYNIADYYKLIYKYAKSKI